MKTYSVSILLLFLTLLLGGCATQGINANIANDTAALQQAMTTNHKAALGTFQKMNDEDLPYLIAEGSTRSSFSVQDLNVLAPADIAAWDKILSALDSYCAALSTLTSGKQATDFTTATESFGSNINSLAKSVGKSTGTPAAIAETAVTELGSILIRHKADLAAQSIAKDADKSFQTVVYGLIEAFGFEGNPPVESSHGILASYEVAFSAGNAQQAKTYKDGLIAGFDKMNADERRTKIKELIAWLSTEQDHDEFVASVKTLVTALNKAALAHTALASGQSETASAAFAQLKVEIQNVQGIYQKYPKG